MKTTKEVRDWLEEWNLENRAYYEWYKEAIEWMLNDIVDAQVTSVETIEKWLQDLLNK